MQEEGDPVRGIVELPQALQETGQERGRLLHKHSQEHTGQRLQGGSGAVLGAGPPQRPKV